MTAKRLKITCDAVAADEGRSLNRRETPAADSSSPNEPHPMSVKSSLRHKTPSTTVEGSVSELVFRVNGASAAMMLPFSSRPALIRSDRSPVYGRQSSYLISSPFWV